MLINTTASDVLNKAHEIIYGNFHPNVVIIDDDICDENSLNEITKLFSQNGVHLFKVKDELKESRFFGHMRPIILHKDILGEQQFLFRIDSLLQKINIARKFTIELEDSNQEVEILNNSYEQSLRVIILHVDVHSNS